MGNTFQWSRYMVDEGYVSIPHDFILCIMNDFMTALFQGTFAGIIIGLTQLNCSELKLRRLCYRQGYVYLRNVSDHYVRMCCSLFDILDSAYNGATCFYTSQSHHNNLSQETYTWLSLRLLGVDKLFSYAINEWLNDIKKNQLPGILGGVGPIHSLVQLGEYNTCFNPVTGCSQMNLNFTV